MKYQIFIHFCKNYSYRRLSTLPVLLGREQMTSSLLDSANTTRQGNQRTVICFCGHKGEWQRRISLCLSPLELAKRSTAFPLFYLFLAKVELPLTKMFLLLGYPFTGPLHRENRLFIFVCNVSSSGLETFGLPYLSYMEAIRKLR